MILHVEMPFKTGWKINVVNIEIISRLTKHHSKQLWITAYIVNVLTIHSFFLYALRNIIRIHSQFFPSIGFLYINLLTASSQ